MSYFDELVKEPKNLTYEGAVGREKTLDQEWSNMIFSSFLQDGFYESKEDYLERLIKMNDKVIEKYGYEFAAKAMNYVRNNLGMRTTSTLLAACLNKHQFEGKRDVFASFFRRPDDVSETFAAIDSMGDKRSHALVRGAADYLSSLSPYTLGKYKLKGRKYNLFDLINLTHAHSAAISDYKKGMLENPETWEVQISTAADDLERQKNWRNLVINGKLGYLALLRNLRNYLPSLSYEDVVKYLVPQLVNENVIEKSLVFPYQIYMAYKIVSESVDDDYFWEYDRSANLHIDDDVRELVINALNNAFIYSVHNVPAIDGKNCVIIDVSGSMNDAWSPSLSIIEVSAVYATAIALRNVDNSEIIKFGTRAKRFDLKKCLNNENIDTVFDIIYLITRNDDLGYGTDIDRVVPLLSHNYDSIFLFSDMQVMSNGNNFYVNEIEEMKDYCRKNPHTPIFSFDLGNYHSRVDTGEDNVYPITALSSNVFDFITIVKSGKTLIDVIRES